jgi:hypothetical protein
VAELFVERCRCGVERRRVDNWCPRCLGRFNGHGGPPGVVSWRPPQLERSRTEAAPLPFGLAARLTFTIPLAFLLLRGWWGVAMHWGSVRMVLDVLWVPAATAMAVFWLQELWATTPATADAPARHR